MAQSEQEYKSDDFVNFMERRAKIIENKMPPHYRVPALRSEVVDQEVAIMDKMPGMGSDPWARQRYLGQLANGVITPKGLFLPTDMVD